MQAVVNAARDPTHPTPPHPPHPTRFVLLSGSVLETPPRPAWSSSQVLSAAAEYDELPVRHNEDKINATMAASTRLPVDARAADDPHTKTNLLLQVWRGG